MRQIGIRQLRTNLSKELQQLPFNITNHGQVIATVANPKQPQDTPSKEKKGLQCSHVWKGIQCTNPAIKEGKCFMHK